MINLTRSYDWLAQWLICWRNGWLALCLIDVGLQGDWLLLSYRLIKLSIWVLLRMLRWLADGIYELPSLVTNFRPCIFLIRYALRFGCHRRYSAHHIHNDVVLAVRRSPGLGYFDASFIADDRRDGSFDGSCHVSVVGAMVDGSGGHHHRHRHLRRRYGRLLAQLLPRVRRNSRGRGWGQPLVNSSFIFGRLVRTAKKPRNCPPFNIYGLIK